MRDYRLDQAMLENAVRICEATFGDIFRQEGDIWRLVANCNTPAAFLKVLKHSPVIRPSLEVNRRRFADKSAVHIVDLVVDPNYLDRIPHIVAAVELGGVRTVLFVPMLKEDEVVGRFVLCRQEVRPFTDKQIELVKNFAAQAVIAIENARLLNELRQRTNDLTEALEQQTATSEVLRVISSSPDDLEPVFARVLENAVRICDAKWGTINRWEGDTVHLMATHNLPPAFAEARRRTALYRPRANALSVAWLRLNQWFIF
jgi:hypothetical protein